MKYLASIILILSLICGSGLSDTINIPGDFRSIQEAIDKARIGDIIIIGSGEYKQDIIIDKGLELRGVGSEKTKIIGSIVVENADPVVIDGFTIEGQGDNAHFGVWCSGSELTIQDCRIFAYHHGIGSETSKLVIKDNFIIRNFNVGIQITTSNSAIIEGNNIEGNIGSGIRIGMSGDKISIIDNVIGGNSIGMEFVQSSPRLRRNVIKNNHVGIQSNNESNPDLGLNNDPGHNVFMDNSTLIINQNRREAIQAMGNYWGGPAGPDVSSFDGKIAYIPWLKENPLKAQAVNSGKKLPLSWGRIKERK